MLKGRLSEKYTINIMKALGLCTLTIGINSALQGDIMLIVVSISVGAFFGEMLGIEERVNKFGSWLESKISKGKGSSFGEGFVTASLLYCVGAMAIVGSIESGLRGDLSVIFTKSVLDGVSSVFFAGSLGIGVAFSSVSVLIYQGIIELFAGQAQEILTDDFIVQISALGGVMIIALGFNLSLGSKLKVANMLPGFLAAIIYYNLFF